MQLHLITPHCSTIAVAQVSLGWSWIIIALSTAGLIVAFISTITAGGECGDQAASTRNTSNRRTEPLLSVNPVSVAVDRQSMRSQPRAVPEHMQHFAQPAAATPLASPAAPSLPTAGSSIQVGVAVSVLDDLTRAVNEAAALRNYERAALLQKHCDQLRSTMDQMSALRQTQEDAVATRDYETAEKVEEQIQRLQKQLSGQEDEALSL